MQVVVVVISYLLGFLTLHASRQISWPTLLDISLNDLVNINLFNKYKKIANDFVVLPLASPDYWAAAPGGTREYCRTP